MAIGCRLSTASNARGGTKDGLLEKIRLIAVDSNRVEAPCSFIWVARDALSASSSSES